MHVLTNYLKHEKLPDFFLKDDVDSERLAKSTESTSGDRTHHLELHQGVKLNAPSKWQIKSAVATWNSMRKIMPVDAWMAY